MRYYPAAVTGDILDIRIKKGGVAYPIGLGTVFEADGSDFTLLVTVIYYGDPTSGGRVYGYVYPPEYAEPEIQYDDDPDRWPYDAPNTQHTYTVDFGPIFREGGWFAITGYTRVISGVETLLANFGVWIFHAGPVIPLPEVHGLVIGSYVRA